METDKGIAIITGASQGIGAVVAKGLANDGYQVVLIARNEENLNKVCNEIMLLGKYIQPPIILPLDLTDSTKEIVNLGTFIKNMEILIFL